MSSVPVVDSHHHLWVLERSAYAHLRGTPALARDMLPAELEPQLADAGVQRTVLVQSDNTAADTDYMFEVAARFDWVAGIVGWLPLHRPGDLAAQLDERMSQPAFRGVRVLDPDPDAAWLTQDAVLESLSILAAHDLTLDVIAPTPAALQQTARLADRIPTLRIIVDHLAKPPIRAAGWEPWASLLAEVSQAQNVFAKLSGLDTAADPASWTADDLRPYVEHALASFGAGRTMFGSNWPICVPSGGYARVAEATRVLLDELTPAEKSLTLGGAAIAAYRLPIRAAAEG